MLASMLCYCSIRLVLPHGICLAQGIAFLLRSLCSIWALMDMVHIDGFGAQTVLCTFGCHPKCVFAVTSIVLTCVM